MDIADYFKEENAPSSLLGFGLLKVMFASAVGWASFAITAFIGAVVFNKD